jgi:hypothetical protein
MHRVDDIFALNGLLQEGNSATGQEPHRVRAAWFNDLRENVARFIEFAGPALIEGDYNQLIDAMKAFVADRASVASVAALRVAPVETGSFMWVSGYHQADGVAAKPYWWDADATAVDDGGSVIAKTGYAGNGRWRAAFVLPYLTPQDWGARGQDGAEDAAAFGAICARLAALGGGHVKIPALGYDYRLGKRGAPKAGTAIEPPSNTIWEFEPGAKIIHNAVTKVVPETGSSFPTAIRLRDVSNVQIIRPDIDGQCTGPAGAGGPIRRAITWEGAGSNIEIVDAFVENCNDYHFGVLDALNADRKCAFDNLQVRGLRSRGQVSPKSIVVEIFPKKSILIDGERRPACANLKLTGIDIDGTNGSLDSTRHAYTGVKISNVNGVFLDEIHVAGGKVAAVSLLNGVRDVKATRIETSRAAVGLNILTQRSVCALRTQNIQVDEFSYDRGGMTGATPYAMIIGGKVPSLNIGKVNNRGGHVALAASSNELLHVGGDALHLDTINATRPGTVTGQTSGAVANVMGFDDGIVAVDRRATVAWSPGETLVSSNGIELTLNSVEDDDELTGALIGPTKMRGAGNISFQTTKRAVALPTPKGLTWGPIVMENDSPGKNLCVFRGNPAQWAPERCTFGPFFLRGAGETAIVIGGVGNRLRPVFDHAG